MAHSIRHLLRRDGLHGALFLIVLLTLAWVLWRGPGPLSLQDGWFIARRDLVNVCVLVLGAVALSHLISRWLAPRLPESLRLVLSTTVFVVLAYCVLAMAPRPVQLQRDRTLTESIGPLGPITTHETRSLTAPWAWSHPFGWPLDIPDDKLQVRYLFRVEPQSDRRQIGIMSCPDFVQYRSALWSGSQAIALRRADLPAGTHVAFDALSTFCWSGIRLSPNVEATVSSAAQERLKRVAGPQITTFDPFELAAAQGHQTLGAEWGAQPTARGRYLLYLALGDAAAHLLPSNEALYAADDFFFAANQCDTGYVAFLRKQGVLYPQQAALYLARELDGTYDRDAQLDRPAQFILGLRPSAGADQCRQTLAALADLAGGSSQLPPEVLKLL